MSFETFKPLLIPALVLALAGCGGQGGAADDAPPAQDSLDTAKATEGGGLVKVGGSLFAVPSPVQTALLIRKLDLPYHKDILLPTAAGERLTTRDQRAIYMGMCGADLAYATVHRDGQRALTMLREVQTLSNALELGNAFDQPLMERFKRLVTNEDSVLRLSGEAFRAADEYLKNSERNDVSALVLTGGWLESLYLTVARAGDPAPQELVARVGEQKRTLDNLVRLLEHSEAGKANAALLAGLKDLAVAYQGVTSSYRYEQPTVDVSAKTTYVNSTSGVVVPPDVLKAITEKVSSLRSTILH